MYDMEFKVERQVRRSTSPAINMYFEDVPKELKTIYDRWGTGVTKFGWDIPISMRGGISTITVEMLKKVPEKQLLKIYFKKRTQLIVNAMSRVSVS